MNATNGKLKIIGLIVTGMKLKLTAGDTMISQHPKSTTSCFHVVEEFVVFLLSAKNRSQNNVIVGRFTN